MISSEPSHLRTSNNFYHKNQSNIFNLGQQVENAINVAKAQPLPPHLSLETSSKPPHESITVDQILEDTTAKDVPYLSHHNQGFTIAGSFNEDIAARRERERKKWVEELEAQIREKKEREGAQRRSRSPSVPHEHNENLTQSMVILPEEQHPAVSHTTPTNTTYPNTALTSPTNHRTSSLGGVVHTSYVRGQNAFIDSEELERRQEVRRRALEQQEFIKAQIQERRNKKIEEEEKRKLEEEMEMIRIEAENRRLKEDAEREKDKVRKKEELQREALSKQQKDIEAAKQEALEFKRQARKKQTRVDGNKHVARTMVETKKSIQVAANNREKKPKPQVHTQVTPTPAPISPSLDPPEAGSPTTKPVAKVYSNVSTQTITDVSCQTDFELVDDLPSETRLIQIPLRELSVIQVENEKMKQRNTNGRQRNTDIKQRNMNIRQRNDIKAGNRVPRNREVATEPKSRTKVPPQKKVASGVRYDRAGRRIQDEGNKPPRKIKPEYTLYDQNGKRIKRESNPSKKDDGVAGKVEMTNRNDNTIQYDQNGRRVRNRNSSSGDNFFSGFGSQQDVSLVVIKENQPLSDILDDPKPIHQTNSEKKTIVSHQLQSKSELDFPESQVQMKYISSHNEEVSIPSPISARQSDILQQLEKLRLELKERRKVQMNRNQHVN